MSEAKEQAAHTIIEFVKAPDMFQCDLLGMPAVRQLEKDAKYSSVYQLLKIFLTQRLDAYLEFQAVNSALLKSYGLVHEECTAKMRLMSLLDLASHESGQIPYALIKDTLRVNWLIILLLLGVVIVFVLLSLFEAYLQINDDEVELWVVKALTAKLINCKMDQMNQVLVVSSCTERVFGQQQWQVLRKKLGTWRGNIASVINTIQANKITEDGSQTVQGMMIRQGSFS